MARGTDFLLSPYSVHGNPHIGGRPRLGFGTNRMDETTDDLPGRIFHSVTILSKSFCRTSSSFAEWVYIGPHASVISGSISISWSNFRYDNNNAASGKLNSEISL